MRASHGAGWISQTQIADLYEGVPSERERRSFSYCTSARGHRSYLQAGTPGSASLRACGLLDTRKFYGKKGVLKIYNWNVPTYTPKEDHGRLAELWARNPVHTIQRADHLPGWLQG